MEVITTTSTPDHGPQPRGGAGSVPVEELARRQGIHPVESVDDMGREGIFESDEELDEFLEHVYGSRRVDLA